MGDRSRPLRATNRRIVRGSDYRVFLQRAGALPSNVYQPVGMMTVEDFELSRDAAEKTKAPSDKRRGEFVTIGQVAQELADPSLAFSHNADKNMNDPWWEMLENAEEGAVLQMVGSKGGTPENFFKWDNKLALYNASVDSVSLAGQKNPQSADDDSVLTVTGNFSAWKAYRILTTKLGAVGALTSAAVREVLDAAWRMDEKNRKRYYFVMTNVAATTPSEVITYNSANGTVNTITPAALATDVIAEKIFVVGEFLILISSTNNSHLYSTLDKADAGIDGFVEITGGYVATKQVNDILAFSVADMIGVGNGGYIYQYTGVNVAPTVFDAGVLTTQNLNVIDSLDGDEIGIGGDSNVILYSEDSGQSYTSKTGPDVGNNITALVHHDEKTWWIGTSSGKLFYTVDGFDTYVEIVLPVIATEITDIVFPNPIVGYISCTVGGVGVVLRTSDSGQTWWDAKPEIFGLGTNTGINALVAPDTNTVAAVGNTASAGIINIGLPID